MKNQDMAQWILECDENPNMPKTNWNELFKGVYPGFIPLLKQLLDYDPERRITAANALKLPFMKSDAPVMPPVEMPYVDFEFENYTLGRDIFRELIQDEVLIYRD
jgi:hypothetical protein